MRLEKLDKYEATWKKTSRMGLFGKLDGDIETRLKKKQQHTNTHKEKTGDRS
jgi:hypothetical protein